MDTRIEENKNQTDDKKVAKDTSGDINEQVVSVPTLQLYQTMVDDSGIFKKTEKMSQDEIASKSESKNAKMCTSC